MTASTALTSDHGYNSDGPEKRECFHNFSVLLDDGSGGAHGMRGSVFGVALVRPPSSKVRRPLAGNWRVWDSLPQCPTHHGEEWDLPTSLSQ
ncbi:hypothetical protein SKAU_G00203760 [Synaphobranchus kaupii]|uniref:Uncharacterized protein n=1 Tax=Synaphobranchus kaupii TaxID=118154 RepID=A0A9Q1FFZ7_SYNKA|nr:hypothetical protein SKAU_G00203760 [Synaphobranchus kaupii]